ncbi:MAG TPA: DciA family protein [Candidatus Margulisiibacteriota bacterium]|nr:DciA family protein [Candidatus Margulisiibacteriota bacterium]
MEQIKETIAGFMQDLQNKAVQKRESPQELLRKVLTKKELSHIKFNYFKGGVLSVNVDSSAWLYSLSLKKEELLVRLKTYSAAVRDIRLRVGRIA